jgi:hypothetical protein
MVWTYDLAKLATSPLYQVRRLVGDVIGNEPQLQDEEINFALTQRSSIYGAAAECCRAIASQYSRKANTAIQGMSVTYSSQAQAYLKMAVTLDAQASARGAGAMPYAGGISESDKEVQEQDSDRVPPQYTLEMNDNLLVPATGADGSNETTTDVAQGS